MAESRSSKLFKRTKLVVDKQSRGPPVYIAPNGEDMSIAMSRVLSDKLVAKGFPIATAMTDANIVCLSEKLSVDAVRAILRSNKVEIDSREPQRLVFTSVRWARQIAGATTTSSTTSENQAKGHRSEHENDPEDAFRLKPDSEEFLWNRMNLWEHIYDEQQRELKRISAKEVITPEFPKEFASGALSLLSLINHDDEITEEGLKSVPDKYREKVVMMSKLPSAN